MESIESIIQRDESTDDEISTLSPQVLMKDIVHELKNLIDEMSSEEVDYNKLNKKLKKVIDILHETEDNSTHEDELHEEELPLFRGTGKNNGTEGMGPRIDSEGKQHYEKKCGSSYAERHGFVGP